jgi:dTDP-4-dehydrorhamnose reductase
LGRSASAELLEHAISNPLGTGQNVLITGAGGQLGAALQERFPDADGRARERFDVTVSALDYTPELVLHAAAWTDVDGAEEHPAETELVNVQGTRNVVGLDAPVVYFSTDYVFDGAKPDAYVETDETAPLSVYGRTKLEGEREVRAGWVVRSSWLFGWSGRNFVRTMLALGRRQGEVQVVDDQRGCPTFVGHLAAAMPELVDLPYGTYHVAAEGDCTWAEFARAIFAEAGLSCRVVPISSSELGRPAQRPANSVLRSVHPETPRLPHWQEGLRECLQRLDSLTIE